MILILSKPDTRERQAVFVKPKWYHSDAEGGKYDKDIETEVKLEKLKLDEVTTEVGRGDSRSGTR